MTLRHWIGGWFKRPVISLLHATRGRVERALFCRREWLRLANEPEKIEHLFAIDADDMESMEGLAGESPLVVRGKGGGCVAAWNLAAEQSRGEILVQLSDDWTPPPGWDREIAERLRPLRKPGVLRISDGHRTDDLLCMAILTRARMRQTGDFLPGAYTGVYSDDEFSFRAFEDGVVVDARDLVFTHHHPNYDDTILLDDTYRRQNEDDAYREARRIFKQRNPEARRRWLVKDHWERRHRPG